MSFELSREQFRTMILYDWKIGLTYKESHVRLVQAWRDQAPSDRTVLNWFHEFQQGNYNVEDADRPGRPRTAVTEETISAVQSIIENDPHSTYQQIEDILGIGSSAVNSIIHDHLNLRKVCAR
jgi:HTH domain in Mos1 transposase